MLLPNLRRRNGRQPFSKKRKQHGMVMWLRRARLLFRCRDNISMFDIDGGRHAAQAFGAVGAIRKNSKQLSIG